MIVGRGDDEISLILPLVHTDGRLLRTAYFLGAVVCHYDEPLIADGPDAGSRLGAALEHAAKAGGIDIFSPGTAKGYRDAVFFQQIQVHFHRSFIGLSKSFVIYGIVFDKIDLGRSKFAELDNRS